MCWTSQFFVVAVCFFFYFAQNEKKKRINDGQKEKKNGKKQNSSLSLLLLLFYFFIFFPSWQRNLCAISQCALWHSSPQYAACRQFAQCFSFVCSSFFFFRFFFSCEVFIATPQNCVWRTSWKNNRLREREREKNFDFSSRKRGTLAFFLPFFFFSNLRFFGTSRSSTVSFFFFKWKAKPYGWWNKKKTEAIAWRE